MAVHVWLPFVYLLLLISDSRCESSSPTTLQQQTSVNFRCPEQFGYYADEYNCSKYFVCVFGEALHESCTGGLRFSSELQTCDWPRNVVCPLEDSNYDNDPDSGFDTTNDVMHLGKSNYGQLDDRASTESMFDGYVKEVFHKPATTTTLHKPAVASTSQPHYSTASPPTFTTQYPEERINEAALQESFDKLVKSSYRKQKQLLGGGIMFELNKTNNITDLSYITLARDLNSNKLDNGTHEEDLRGDDLEENFTLVDLQRSPLDLANNKLFRKESQNQSFHDNILGTIGRSVNGANSAQSVSVVASTSSEATIPELQFMFDKHIGKKKEENKPTSESTRKSNPLTLNSLLQLGDYVGPSPGLDSEQNRKFTETIAAILNENGAIHIEDAATAAAAEDDGPTLLRILSPSRQPHPGTAASNRNLASQQVLQANYEPSDGKKPLFQTSQSNRPKQRTEFDDDSASTPPVKPNTILVFNRTQLISIPAEPKDGNSSSTFILIDHQQPSSSIRDGRKSLLAGFEPIDQTSRQPPLVSTRINVTHNKTSLTTSGVRLGSKERVKSGKSKSTYLDSSDALPEEILVNIPPSSASSSDLPMGDFHRLHQDKSSISDSELRNVQYNNSNSTIARLGQGRHLGTHHRHHGSKNGTTFMRTVNTHKNVSLQIASRPLAMYQTPEPLSTAIKCSEPLCRLPDCFCGDTKIPGGLPVKDVPQLVLISFDDSVNDINWHIYEELLNSGRSNPNGCPIKATFYVSHEWTDYSQVQTLYSRGHEIASHSITHSFGERFTKQQWHREIAGQREILHHYGGVNRADIRGMRAPFLQGGGNKQFEMLHENNFTYDSSMPVFENSPPFWPYTLDYAINHECMIAPCPTKAFPGLWEIGLVMWQDLHGGRCSMGDACSNPADEKGVYELIMKNFKRHYNSNRAPFGLYYHSAWFNNEHHRRGFIRVIDDLLTYYKDVYFVTKWELIQWIRNPTPLKELYRINLFGCARDPNRPPPCLHPNICNVGSHSSSRFLKTCQPCPKRYPWLGDTGH